MQRRRDPVRTRNRIIDAARCVFSEKGFEAATLTAIARQAAVSKQLLQHHFGTKEALFRTVHRTRFRPTIEWDDTPPADPMDLIGERFLKRVRDHDYTRFLTWEAASGRRDVPGLAARKKRLADTAAMLEQLQKEGGLPKALDPRLVHLIIVALSTYPVAFAQNTRLITGHSPASAEFQRQWSRFLRTLWQRLTARDGDRERHR